MKRNNTFNALFICKGENFSKMTKELIEVNKKLEAVQKNVAIVIARELQPHLNKSTAVKVQATPVLVSSSNSGNDSNISSSSFSDDGLVPTAAMTCHDDSYNSSSETLMQLHDPEVADIDDGVAVAEEEVDLLSLSELTQIFVKSCSRGNMASKLVRNLFDETTRKTSNVNGRNKKRLDPTIMAYVKRKCFEFFPSTGSDRVQEDWAKCILAIDESCRRLNNKPRKKKIDLDESNS